MTNDAVLKLTKLDFGQLIIFLNSPKNRYLVALPALGCSFGRWPRSRRGAANTGFDNFNLPESQVLNGQYSFKPTR